MKSLQNSPSAKLGVVAVSRDCFPIELARRRLGAVVSECEKQGVGVTPCSVIIESETDAMKAVAEMRGSGVNAVVVYLGNFGPEGPLTIFAREFGGPFMLCGAAEESGDDLIDGRGDAYCGMLNAALNAGLRNLRPHVPAMPIGLPDQIARMMAHFEAVARVALGIRSLKVFSFGPHPQDFYACNAPIKPLYDLGVEVMENSELDMYLLYQEAAARTDEIKAKAAEMAAELGAGNQHPEKLAQLAQFEIALETFMETNLGSRQFGVFANKCWPAFEKAFGFVPCFVNSRLAARGIPAACEVDIYGAVSEYMAQLASSHPATILDINNTVPADLPIADLKGASREDLFMGFHCGNTASDCLCDGYCMKFQLIMNRLMEEPGAAPDITCGTLEGRLKNGPATVFRVQADLRANGLMSYIAQGEVLDVDPRTFGCAGIFAIPGFARFYRHVLIERQFPHHSAVAFRHAGAVLYDAARILGIEAIHSPRPAGVLYESENPFGR